MRPLPSPPRLRTAAAVTLACALTLTAQSPARADPAPAPRTLAEVRAELQRLYREAAVATDKYNAAEEKVTHQQKRVRALNGRVETTEARLAGLTERAGAAARAQYRGGGDLPAEVQFVFSGRPERALDGAARTRQAHRSTQNLLTALTRTREELGGQRDKAVTSLEDLRKNRRAMDTQRERIEKRISAAERLESRLAEEQRRELAELEREETADAQARWVDTGILDQAGTEATGAGRKALAYATRQIGKPYVWGAEGPDSFDCSGLTSQAWLAAGTVVPRTSQEQWRRLERVPVADMRPGDLIIYFPDASHVGIYAGDGDMVHAPRPGRSVTVAPAGSMEILGVVRPDA
ncbi:NlpC/P60 family protein [Streptomyces griseoflavus]|uniref:C40 family peptidase n=1 Tax=Streptomyces griseoflavus TaxID=35619 RepID=UPI00167D9F79|nr:C40 family peptidase [Streptomyces griseoflavus]GGV17952.1 glycoside hydrolase [Streptomyces griseoflavus]